MGAGEGLCFMVPPPQVSQDSTSCHCLLHSPKTFDHKGHLCEGCWRSPAGRLGYALGLVVRIHQQGWRTEAGMSRTPSWAGSELPTDALASPVLHQRNPHVDAGEEDHTQTHVGEQERVHPVHLPMIHWMWESQSWCDLRHRKRTKITEGKTWDASWDLFHGY